MSTVVIAQPPTDVLLTELAEAAERLYWDGYHAYIAGEPAYSDEPAAWLDGWLAAQQEHEEQTGVRCRRRIRDAYTAKIEKRDSEYEKRFYGGNHG